VNADAPDDWRPLVPDEDARQIDALLALLSDRPRRALDLGAGDGRAGAPLHQAGHTVEAIDIDPDAVRRCRQRGLCAREGDMLDRALDLRVGGSAPEAALLLGHTFLLVHDPLEALALLRRLSHALAPGGVILLDDFCEGLWEEVHSGAWRTGVSEDGSMQMVWAPGEPVFALRRGDAVDPEDDHPRPGERLFRLWSLGELRLLASCAGLEGPENDPTGALLILRTGGQRGIGTSP